VSLLPQPQSVKTLAGVWRAPAVVVVQCDRHLHPIVRSAISLCPDKRLVSGIRLEHVGGDAFCARSPEGTCPARPDGPEAYRLRISPRGIGLSASDEAGLRWGVLTLMQMMASGRSIRACEVEDRPALALRGLMIDMVRLKERDEVYFRMLEEIAAWKMNALFLHFTDSDGCSIELKSHPEVVTRNAMSQETLRRLIARGKELGVRVIPEVEAWGHAGWATGPHKELSEAGKGSFCLSNEAAYEFLEDVISEVAGIFPDECTHIGCDEASYGACEKCKARAAACGEEKLISGHINRLNGIVNGLGKTSIVWGDIILRSEEMLSMLDKNIIVENWDYKETVRRDKLAMLREHQRRALAGPALMWNGYKICPSRNNFENTRRFCEHARAENAEGVATTVWLTQRCIPTTLGYGIAWAAENAWSAKPGGLEDVAAAYLRHRFGLEPTTERTDRMARMADVGQREGTISPAFWWKTEMLLDLEGPASEDRAGYAAKLRGLESGLKSDLALVRFHRQDYESHMLAAACGEHIVLRQETGAEAVRLIREAQEALKVGKTERAQTALRRAAEVVRDMENARAALFARMQEHWDIDRYHDDAERSGGGVGGSHILNWWFGSKDTYGYAEDLAMKLAALAAKPDSAELDALLPATAQSY